MGLRFRKSVKIAPGVKVNLNKKSTSVTFGGKGVHRTISSTGKKTTSVGLPGSGAYYTTSSGGTSGTNKKKVSSSSGHEFNVAPPQFRILPQHLKSFQIGHSGPTVSYSVSCLYSFFSLHWLDSLHHISYSVSYSSWWL